MDRLTGHAASIGNEIGPSKYWTETEGSKIRMLLGDSFVDMAVIPTVSVNGGSNAVTPRRRYSSAAYQNPPTPPPCASA